MANYLKQAEIDNETKLQELKQRLDKEYTALARRSKEELDMLLSQVTDDKRQPSTIQSANINTTVKHTEPETDIFDSMDDDQDEIKEWESSDNEEDKVDELPEREPQPVSLLSSSLPIRIPSQGSFKRESSMAAKDKEFVAPHILSQQTFKEQQGSLGLFGDLPPSSTIKPTK